MLSSAAQGSNSEQTASAFLNQTKIDERVQAYAKQLVSPEIQRHVGNLALIVKALSERKVEVRWQFH